MSLATAAAPTSAPATAILPVASTARTRAASLRLLLARPWLLAATTLTLLAGSAVALAAPAILGSLVDTVIDSGSTAAIWWHGAALLGAGALAAVLVLVGRLLLAQLTETTLATLREDVFETATSLPIEDVERAGTGDLVARVSGDVTTVSQAASGVLPGVVRATFTIGLTLVGMGALDWCYAVAALAAVPIQVIALRRLLRASGPLYREQRRAEGARAQQLLETVSSARTVSALDLADHHERLVATASLAAVQPAIDAMKVTTRFYNRLNFAELAGLGAVLAVGFHLVTTGVSTVGAATAAALYFHGLFGPVGTLLGQFDELQKAGAGLARLVGVTDLRRVRVAAGPAPVGHVPAGPPPAGSAPAGSAPAPTVETDADRPATAGRVPLEARSTTTTVATATAIDTTPTDATPHDPSRPPSGADVRVRGVRYAYDARRTVLHDVDLRIAPGESVALVGASGAGKTTIARIVAAVTRPSSGQVLIDAHDVHDLPPDALRRAVAMVSQEVHVFAGTLAQDLRLAAPDADDDRLARVLAGVGAHWVTDLPEGLDTPIGSAGLHLDDDRAQQLALARVVLADPRLVVLDEATAQAGSGAARVLDQAAGYATAGRSALVVAHRLSQAAAADRILVLEAGRVVEEGTHERLVAAGGEYARMWRAWSARR